MHYFNHTTRRFRQRCLSVLALWLLSTLSTALMAASPGIEEREGYIALCTAQGIKWIAVESPQQDASTGAISADQTPPLEHTQLIQHCSECVVGQHLSADLDLYISSGTVSPERILRAQTSPFERAENQPTTALSYHAQPRAPPA